MKEDIFALLEGILYNELQRLKHVASCGSCPFQPRIGEMIMLLGVESVWCEASGRWRGPNVSVMSSGDAFTGSC